MTDKSSQKKHIVETKAVSTNNTADSDYLKNTQGTPGPESLQNAEEDFIRALLEDLDFLTHKEKKDQTESAQQQSDKVMQQLKNAPPSVAVANNMLLGILGPCALKGHIVHFYNLNFQIQKHIKTIDELQDPRFVEAYHFLRANPSIEAVFVYPNKIKAYYRVGSQILSKHF